MTFDGWFGHASNRKWLDFVGNKEYFFEDSESLFSTIRIYGTKWQIPVYHGNKLILWTKYNNKNVKINKWNINVSLVRQCPTWGCPAAGILVQNSLFVKPLIINVVKCLPCLQNSSMDLTEIWPQFLPFQLRVIFPPILALVCCPVLQQK